MVLYTCITKKCDSFVKKNKQHLSKLSFKITDDDSNTLYQFFLFQKGQLLVLIDRK